MENRKRSTTDINAPDFPPRKLHAVSSSSAVTLPSLGPALPLINNPDEVAIDSDSEDDSLLNQMPGPAPDHKRSDTQKSQSPDGCSSKLENSKSAEAPITTSSTEKRPQNRIFGPSAPPAIINDPTCGSNSDHESSTDSDDDFGPSLPPSNISIHEASHDTPFKDDSSDLKPSSDSKPQRAEWMLAPPSSSDWKNRIDPTKLKNRKFTSGKATKTSGTQSSVSTIWTETPEEKRQRLEDEVLGRAPKPSSTSSQSTAQTRKQERETEATERLIREYNEKNRNISLMKEREVAQAQGRLKQEEEDDPSKRGFDREKDMALGGRMGFAKKRELLSRAADFGSRFQKGKYL